MKTSGAIPGTTERPAPSHVRLQGSVLAGVEKRALVWMAARLPASVNPDHLSALGLVSMAGVGASFWLAGTAPRVGLPMVVVCLFLNWFGDSLDGTLARVRNKLRPRYGFYVDHVIDVAGTTFMMAGLGASGFMDPALALVVLAAWLAVSAESFLATHARGEFRMSVLWFGPTELRVVIAVGALRLMAGGQVAVFGMGPYRLFDIGAVAAAAGLAIAFVANAVRNGVALYREETR
jgi:archaetidylinositol phosphate synthase